MRKQLKTKVEIGDENYVAPGEFFLEIGEDNKVPTALKRRKDDLTMETILGSGSGDDSKTFRMNFTETEWEDFHMYGSMTLTDISEEDLTKLGNGGYKEIIISVDGVDDTYPIWYEQTRYDFENADVGVDINPTDDRVICVFGDSYSAVTYRTYYITNDKNEISLVNASSFGFVPAPHLNYYVKDFHYYKDSGNPTQLGTSNWFYQYMNYDRCTGITMADCDFYPIYDSTTINDAARTIDGASIFGQNTQVFFFGKITKSDNVYTESSDQFVIWRDDSEMGIWKAMEISDWTDDFEPQIN